MENQHIRSVKISEDVTVNSNIPDERINDFFYPHRLEVNAFLIVTSGQAKLTINLYHFHIQRNSLVIVLYGSIVQLTERSDDFNVELIIFSPEFVKEIDLIKGILPHLETVRNHGILSVTESNVSLIMEFYTLFSKVYHRMEQYMADNPQVLRHLLISFFHSIIAIYNQGIAKSDNRILSRQDQITKDLMGLIVKHYREERSISFYADKLNVTPKYLSSTVKKVMDRTVSDIIAEAVILDAQAQLKLLDYTIQEISDSLNFADQSFFGKYFKRHTGMSPKSYRESISN